MPLTELQVRSAKPQPKIAKLSDGGGLQLWVTPDGAKRWRLAYRFAGGQKLLAIGVYPSVGLKEARTAREKARRLLADGVDPSEARKQAKIEKANAADNTFAAIAAELVDKKRREQKAGSRLPSRSGFWGWPFRRSATARLGKSPRLRSSPCSEPSNRAANLRPQSACAPRSAKSFAMRSPLAAPTSTRPGLYPER